MNKQLDFETPIVEMQKLLDKFKELQGASSGEFNAQIRELEEKIEKRRKELYVSLSAWQTVQLARHPQRPVLEDYISMIFTEFIELHGDRNFGDDRALIGGFCRLNKYNVMLIGHNKGKNVDQNVERNFGCARPEGYRKALRLMKLAQKYNVPIVTIIDTQGAYPSYDSEERGQPEAIARNLTEMAQLRVPIITIVTGEGGSGGALGIGVCDVLLMLSHAIYSVISPEGCASILCRDASPGQQAQMAQQTAEAMKITASALYELGVVDEVIAEPVAGAHTDPVATTQSVKLSLEKHLKQLSGISSSRLINRRFEKYSKIGSINK